MNRTKPVPGPGHFYDGPEFVSGTIANPLKDTSAEPRRPAAEDGRTNGYVSGPGGGGLHGACVTFPETHPAIISFVRYSYRNGGTDQILDGWPVLPRTNGITERIGIWILVGAVADRIGICSWFGSGAW